MMRVSKPPDFLNKSVNHRALATSILRPVIRPSLVAVTVHRWRCATNEPVSNGRSYLFPQLFPAGLWLISFKFLGMLGLKEGLSVHDAYPDLPHNSSDTVY